MRSYAREKAASALRLAGLCRFRRRQTFSRPRILMYHGIGSGVTPNEVRVQRFEEQMSWLVEHCQPVPLSELFEEPSTQADTRESPRVAVTFDDGLRGLYDHAAPILKALKIPSTVFMVTDLMEAGTPVWTSEVHFLVLRLAESGSWPDKLLEHPIPHRHGTPESLAAAVKTWMKDLPPAQHRSALRELRASCDEMSFPRSELTLTTAQALEMARDAQVSLQSHSSSHAMLPTLNDQELEYEIAGSRDRLGKLLGCPPRYFCYPDGRFNKRVADAVRSAGYEAAVSTIHGLVRPGNDLFSLPRIGIYRDTSMNLFEVKVSGWWG